MRSKVLFFLALAVVLSIAYATLDCAVAEGDTTVLASGTAIKPSGGRSVLFLDVAVSQCIALRIVTLPHITGSPRCQLSMLLADPLTGNVDLESVDVTNGTQYRIDPLVFSSLIIDFEASNAGCNVTMEYTVYCASSSSPS